MAIEDNGDILREMILSQNSIPSQTINQMYLNILKKHSFRHPKSPEMYLLFPGN